MARRVRYLSRRAGQFSQSTRMFIELAATEDASGLVRDAFGLVRDSTGIRREASGLAQVAARLIRKIYGEEKLQKELEKLEELDKKAAKLDVLTEELKERAEEFSNPEYPPEVVRDVSRLMIKASGLIRDTSGLIREIADAITGYESSK